MDEHIVWATCGLCWAYVPRENADAHYRWHENQIADQEVAHAHQENLIERMHAAEKRIDGLANRVHLVERTRPGPVF